MSKFIAYYNGLMRILNGSRNIIEDRNIQKAKQILHQYHNHWEYTKRILNMNMSLGKNYHYLCHTVEYISIWNIPIGFVSEQSVDTFHKICCMIWHRYYNQQGVMR